MTTSLLGKRKSLTEKEALFDDSRLIFFRAHTPELLEHDGRLKNFLDYEFPHKQSMLKKFWQRTLSLFFRNALKGTVVYWGDLLEFFNVEGSFPLGLAKILVELASEGEYLIVQRESELRRLARVLDLEPASREPDQGLWTRFKGLFRPEQPLLADTSLVVNVSQFKTQLQQVQAGLPAIFEEQRVLFEEEFLRQFDERFRLNRVDQQALLVLLLHTEVLYKQKAEGAVLYYMRDLAREAPLELETQMQEALVGRRARLFDNKLEELNEAILGIGKELMILKAQGRKQEAMQLLQKRRIMSEQLERLNSKRMLLAEMLNKIRSARDERALAEVLKRTNDLFKDNERRFEVISDALDGMQAADQQAEAIGNLIADMQRPGELEEMYEGLEEMGAPSGRIVEEPLVTERPSIAQSKPRVNRPDAQLTESQLFQKRINELLE